MRVIASLTTMPDHYPRLLHTLKSLHQQTYPLDAIYLGLPEKSRRLNIIYPLLPTEITELCTIVPCDDYGPMTKILGALLMEADPNTVIITFDDDQYYPETMVEKLIIHHKEFPNSAIGSSGMLLKATCPLCAITPNEQTGLRSVATFNIPQTGRKVDSIYGYPSALYLRKFFPNKDNLESEFLKYALINNDLFCNDDITISGYLSLKNIERRIFSDLPEIQPYNGTRLSSELSYDLFTCMNRMNRAIIKCKELGMYTNPEPVAFSETLFGIGCIIVLTLLLIILGIIFYIKLV